jgi:hypothetical protein
MSRLRGLHKFVSELPEGFSVDPSTGFLYYTKDGVKDKIGKVCDPEDEHYSFFIRLDEVGKEKFEEYQKYWESLRPLTYKKIAGGLVLLMTPIPRL